MLDPPTWDSPALGWCWRCDSPVKFGAPKQEPERDAWVIELLDATAQEAEDVAFYIEEMYGEAYDISRGTVAGVFYKRARGLK